MNTTENNILIADFIGFEKTFVRNGSGKKYDYQLLNGFELIKETETTIESVWCEVLQEQDCCMAEDLKFNSSWDWLMPVIEKIESNNLENVNCITFLVKISNTNCQIIDLFKDRFEINVYGNTKIDAVYKAVIEFIKWYNENNK